MKYPLLLLILLLVSCSQNSKLTGDISTRTGSETVKQTSVNVYIFKREVAERSPNIFKDYDKAAYRATTDSDGKFSIALPRGLYNVVAEAKSTPIRVCWSQPIDAHDPEESITLNSSNAHHGTLAETCGDDSRLSQ